MFTIKLTALDRPALQAHFLALGADDRRLRFGFPARDGSIERYVNDIDFDRDAVFGVQGEDRRLDGVTHLALAGSHAEIGVSVLEHARGRGIGSALVSRSAVHARNRGFQVLFMQCLSENRAIMRIARALGMKVLADGAQAEASLVLPLPTPIGMLRETLADPVALYDAALKHTLLRYSSSAARAGDGTTANAVQNRSNAA